MRTLLITLAAALAAVALALWFQELEGYVVAVVPPYRLQISLPLLVLLSLGVLGVGYGAIRLVTKLASMPSRLRRWRDQRRALRVLELLERTLANSLTGRPREGFRLLERLHRLRAPASAGAAAALVCEAAILAQDEPRAENALGRLSSTGPWQAVRAVLMVRFGLTFRREDKLSEGLELLEQGEGVAPSVKERLRFEAACFREDWQRALEVARRLRRHELMKAEEFLRVASTAYPALIRARLREGQGIASWWATNPQEERSSPELVVKVVEVLMAEGATNEALHIAEESLKSRYVPELLAILVPVLPVNSAWLRRLEDWHEAFPKDPIILEGLVRLCLHLRLNGKAKEYWNALLEVAPKRAAAIAGEWWLLHSREMLDSGKEEFPPLPSSMALSTAVTVRNGMKE
ncbi:MAG: hypothetical protein N2557_01280 [Hydrogenophilus sp.]|nr:hypothetical protein [Hydrogenophilus sp.]